jgi:molybdenum cofactor cytidylyltransferase
VSQNQESRFSDLGLDLEHRISSFVFQDVTSEPVLHVATEELHESKLFLLKLKHMKNSAASIIILAAGNSSRLGLPKQLLQYEKKSFLRLIAEKALEIQPLEAIAVLGFDFDRMQKEIHDLPVRTVLNHEWREGIASSIRAGINAVDLDAKGALISVCDQPAVTSELLNGLISLCSHEKPIAATKYDKILGVPACYDRTIFPELLLLRGDRGAKRVIGRDESRVVAYSFPQASIDIDTLQDYQNQLPRMPDELA